MKLTPEDEAIIERLSYRQLFTYCTAHGRDSQRMRFCVLEAQNGWSPLGVREMGVDAAAELEHSLFGS